MSKSESGSEPGEDEQTSSKDVDEPDELSREQVTSADNEIKNDHEDPIPSGTGSVNKDCSASDLIGWSEILPKWHSKLNQRPKGLDSLVRNGVPDPLRGEVWQLLSGAHQHQELMDKYRILLTKQAPSEQIILCDVHRTYPAHKNFRSDSNQSDSLIEPLYKVCKAYAVYDEEIGYCQGLSFLVAALLLHMPEEQAFCVFVRIMEDYGLRNLFRQKFDELYLKFFQLEQLIHDQIPDLHQHFSILGLKPYTYASQWFLTVFTAKFPLNAVFHIMDIFLLDGMNTVFQIAIALLKLSRQELLDADFEGVFKLFRVGMPKRYLIQENLVELIDVASNVNLKKLNKYSKTYEIMKQKEKNLASANESRSYQEIVLNLKDEKARLEVEINQLKEVCRRELQRAEAELQRDSNIISGYKQICTQQSERLDKKLELVKQFIGDTETLLEKDDTCSENLLSEFKNRANDLFRKLASDDSEQNQSTNDRQEDNKQSKLAYSNDINGDTCNQGNTNSTSQESSSEMELASQKSQRPIGAYVKSASGDLEKSENLVEHINRLEMELAKTKLALVEAECKCQQLSHELTVGVAVKTSPTMTARSTFSKLNSIIGEKLSLISAPYTDFSSNAEPSSPTHLAKSLQQSGGHRKRSIPNYKDANDNTYNEDNLVKHDNVKEDKIDDTTAQC